MAAPLLTIDPENFTQENYIKFYINFIIANLIAEFSLQNATDKEKFANDFKNKIAEQIWKNIIVRFCSTKFNKPPNSSFNVTISFDSITNCFELNFSYSEHLLEYLKVKINVKINPAEHGFNIEIQDALVKTSTEIAEILIKDFLRQKDLKKGGLLAQILQSYAKEKELNNIKSLLESIYLFSGQFYDIPFVIYKLIYDSFPGNEKEPLIFLNILINFFDLSAPSPQRTYFLNALNKYLLILKQDLAAIGSSLFGSEDPNKRYFTLDNKRIDFLPTAAAADDPVVADPRKLFDSRLRTTDYFSYDPLTQVIGLESQNIRKFREGKLNSPNQDSVFTKTMSADFKAKYRSWNDHQRAKFNQKLTARAQAKIAGECGDKAKFSGTTFSLTFVDEQKGLVDVADVGDSPVYMIYRNKKGEWRVKLLSAIHRLDKKNEKNRLDLFNPEYMEANTRFVYFKETGKVPKHTNLTRVLGVTENKFSSSIPEVNSFDLPDDQEEVYIFSSCDGPYEGLKGEELVFQRELENAFNEYLGENYYQKENARKQKMLEMLNHLKKNAMERGSSDDISMLLKRVSCNRSNTGELTCMVVADGNGDNGEEISAAAVSAVDEIMSNPVELASLCTEVENECRVEKEVEDRHKSTKTLKQFLSDPETRRLETIDVDNSVIARLTLGYCNCRWLNHVKQANHRNPTSPILGEESIIYANVFQNSSGKRIAVTNSACDTNGHLRIPLSDTLHFIKTHSEFLNLNADIIFIPLLSEQPWHKGGKHWRLLCVEKGSDGQGNKGYLHAKFTLIDPKAITGIFRSSRESKDTIRNFLPELERAHFDKHFSEELKWHQGIFDFNDCGRYIVDYIEQLVSGNSVSDLKDRKEDSGFVQYERCFGVYSDLLAQNNPAELNRSSELNEFSTIYKMHHNCEELVVQQCGDLKVPEHVTMSTAQVFVAAGVDVEPGPAVEMPREESSEPRPAVPAPAEAQNLAGTCNDAVYDPRFRC